MAGLRTVISLAIAATALGACQTPGIDYEARLMANDPNAASIRDVSVDRFRGPMGGWYTDRFAAMLANATLDGERWFRFADYAGPASDRPVGVYTGDIDIIDYHWNDYTRVVTKCVEWDGLFDCERRAEVEELCFEESVAVAVTPRLIDRDTGQVLYSHTYGGDAGDSHCEEIGRHRRGYRTFGFDHSPPSGLVRSALAETFRSIRVDIAPRNATVRAEFVTEAIDPVAKADPLFKQGIEAVKSDPYTSCAIWQSMSETYPNAPAVIHNMGACAEASSDFITAQSHYARAAELTSSMGANADTMRPFIRSLESLSNQRFGLELIEEFRGDDDYLPVEIDGSAS